jgi:predicted acylesterase/phospholipase RssA
MEDEGDGIGLTLSGGGFRATLFHLGVVRFIFEVNLLRRVHLVSAVSGGSIFAAHLIVNWEKYTNSKEDFDAAAREILDFIQTDIRGRVLRRWILGCSTIVPRFLLPKEWQWSLVNLLQRQYARLFRVRTASFEAALKPSAVSKSGSARVDITKSAGAATYRQATIKDLRGDRPAVRFNCTSLTTGEPCYFDRAGFGWYKDGVIEAPIPALSLPLAYAVTASSAFPPLFPPVEISHETLSCDRIKFEHEQRLTDGGIYDNLGIRAIIARYKEGTSAQEQRVLFRTIIISDAEGNFDSDFDAKYSFPVNRNVRASDLLMKRVSILHLEEFEQNLEGVREEEKLAFVRVKIREAVRDLDDKTVLGPEAQRALINVRTDLDSFTPDEVTALVAHGYSKAREALLDRGVVGVDAPKFSWDPLGNWDVVRVLPANEFQRSRLRKWRLWSLSDPISWITGLYALFICLLLLSPTLLFAVHSSVQTQRAVEATQRAKEATTAAAIAQIGILTDAMSQTQNLMESISQGCPGGAHGVPPVNWASLQQPGNMALNALNEARLALVRNYTMRAKEQIIFAQGQLEALVNGVHNDCSGGASGQDPVAYKAYTASIAELKERLDLLMRSLEMY